MSFDAQVFNSDEVQSIYFVIRAFDIISKNPLPYPSKISFCWKIPSAFAQSINNVVYE